FSTHHLFQHPPTTQISTLSLHDALPIWHVTQSFRREIHSVLHSFCAPSLGLNSDIMAPMKSRHIVLVLLFLLSMITYVDRVCISVAGPRMQQDLGITPEKWGWVVGVFAIAYAAFEL